MFDMDYSDKPREACGLFGIYGHPEAAKLSYFGLYALQHRGQESAGIAVARDFNIAEHKGMGLVPDVFDATPPPEAQYLPMRSRSWSIIVKKHMLLRITVTSSMPTT